MEEHNTLLIKELARITRRDYQDVLNWADPDNEMTDWELAMLDVPGWIHRWMTDQPETF